MTQRRRRGYGEGSICQRSDGRWMARLAVGYTSTGKRSIRTVYGRTKKEVLDKLASLQHRKAAGTLTDASKMTVAQWLEHWLDTIAKPQLRATTYISYRGAVNKYLIPRLGRIQLAKLSPVNLQALYAEMQAEGASGRQRLKVHQVIRRALNVAMRHGLVLHNPCQLIDPPKYQRPEMQTLDSHQVAKLVATSEGDRLHALIVLAVTTGLRQGEVFGLHWSDINLETGTLSVRRTQLEIGGKIVFGPPKSKSGTRALQLPAVAIEALTLHRAKMMREGFAGNALVFCGPNGCPIRRSKFLRTYFKPLLRRAELPDIRFHDLRHTSATMLLADGVHPKIVQQRLGHSTIALTIDVYSHVLPTMDAAAAGTFDRLLHRNR